MTSFLGLTGLQSPGPTNTVYMMRPRLKIVYSVVSWDDWCFRCQVRPIGCYLFLFLFFVILLGDLGKNSLRPNTLSYSCTGSRSAVIDLLEMNHQDYLPICDHVSSINSKLKIRLIIESAIRFGFYIRNVAEPVLSGKYYCCCR